MRCSTLGLIAVSTGAVAFVVAAAAIEGQLGVPRIAATTSDISRGLGLGHTFGGSVGFPLSRDVVAWYTGLSAPYTIWVARHQWRLMSSIFGDLEHTGVVVERSEPAAPHTMLRATPNTIAELREVAHRWVTTIDRLWPVWLLISILIVGLLTFGESRSLFVALTPGNNSPGHWQHAAYRSWWASWNHPFGFVAYFVIAASGFFFVILVVAVGLVAGYVTVMLRHVAHLRVDWFNIDGRYGWRAIAQIYRSVYVAMFFHGSVVLTFFFLLRPKSALGAVAPVFIFLLSLILFLVVPRVVFHTIGVNQKQSRLAALEPATRHVSLTQLGDVTKLTQLIAEIERVHEAKIHPLRLKGELPRFTAVVAIPMAVGIAETLATVLH
jgi:hypothetical protein